MSRLEDTMQPTLRESRATTMPTLLLRVRRIRLPKSPSRSACSPSQSHIHFHPQLHVPLLKCRTLLPSRVPPPPQSPFIVLAPRQSSHFHLRLRLHCPSLACPALTSGIR